MGPELFILALLGGGAAFGALTYMDDAEPSPSGFKAAGAEEATEEDADTGSDPDDVIWQGDSLWLGDDMDNVVALFGGNDLGLGGDGNDEIAGGDGDDRLLGEEGFDTIFGDVGDDLLMDGLYDRSDLDEDVLRLWTDALEEEAFLFEDDDDFFGGFGDDVIQSTHGFDLAYGNEGDDLIVTIDMGNPGSDGLYGGAGNDRLLGDNHDVMIGGEGADQFEVDFSSNFVDDSAEGRVSILDFNRSEDIIILHDAKATIPAFDLDGPRDQVLEPMVGQIVATEYVDYVHLDIEHLDGSVSELARLRFNAIEDVDAAISEGQIQLKAA